MEDHKGVTHPTIKRKGHFAKLDVQTDIAYIIGVSRSTLNNYLKNRQPIPLENLQRLGKIFNCNWEYLCGKQDYRTPPEGFLAAYNNAIEKAKYAKEHDLPQFGIAIAGDNIETMTVTCNKYPVRQLILKIAQLGGYTEIMEGLKLLSDDIAAANYERNKPMTF